MENWQNPYETRESLYRGWELHELGRRLSAIALALLVLMLAQKGLGLLALLVRPALRARGRGLGRGRGPWAGAWGRSCSALSSMSRWC